MKNLLILLFTFLVFVSCSTNDDTPGPEKLIGTWLLIEQYSDPGDGSGDFTSVNSQKTIEFLNDGAIASNGSLCSMNIVSDVETLGNYDTSENSISPSNCSSSNYVLSYSINGSNLIVNYPCIEACSQKFKKI